MDRNKSGLMKWLLVLAGITLLGIGLSALLGAQGVRIGIYRAGYFTGGLTALLQLFWLAYGVWSWRDRLWVRFAGVLGMGTYFMLAVGALTGTWTTSARYYVYWQDRGASIAIAVVGVWGLCVSFSIGLALIRFLLSPGYPIIGVARTFIDEAIRMKVAVVFIVLLAVLIPVLATGLDPSERLQYRMQFFLTWSLGVLSLTLSLVTIFMTCWTVSADLQYRQIFMTMTKPVSRLQYLLGKWLGITMLNLLLVAVSGVGIWSFARVLQRQDAIGIVDRAAVDSQILAARVAVQPRLPPGQSFDQEEQRRIKMLQQEKPEVYGPPDKPAVISDKDRETIRKQIMAQWHSIGPRQGKIYMFYDLAKAKKPGAFVQLKIEPKSGTASPDGKFRLTMRVNGNFYRIPDLAERVPHVLQIPADMIDDNGDLRLELFNIDRANPARTHTGDVSMDPGSGLQLYYQVGSFEPNLAKGLVVVWLRLVFLAIVGIAAATFLGFHVAALASMLVFFIALGSGFLSEALQYYGGLPFGEGTPIWQIMTGSFELIIKHLSEGKVWSACKIIIQGIGEGAILVIPSFSKFDAVSLISDGLLVTQDMVTGAIVFIGFVWSGVFLLLAWVLFSRRELARVIV